MKLIPAIIPLIAVTSTQAASLLTLSNPVSDGAIDTTATNNIRSDWAGLTAYPADGDETLALDYESITIAHDSTSFYIRQVMNSTPTGFFSGDQLFVFDTDQNRGTGYTGGAGTFAVGGEYLLTGNTLLQYTGTGTDWSWNTIGTIVYDDFPTNDHEMTLSRASIGSPDAFDFVAVTDFWGGGDAYPNGGQGGAVGDFYTYTTVVPEPASVLLGSLGLLALLKRRDRNR